MSITLPVARIIQPFGDGGKPGHRLPAGGPYASVART